MELYACGWNFFGQLQPRNATNANTRITNFTRILKDETESFDVKNPVIFLSWSQTVVQTRPTRLIANGYRHFVYDSLHTNVEQYRRNASSDPGPNASSNPVLLCHHSIVGYNGLVALLDHHGQLCMTIDLDNAKGLVTQHSSGAVVTSSKPQPNLLSPLIIYPPKCDTRPKFAAMARIATGVTVCIPKQTPSANMMHVLSFTEFGSLSDHLSSHTPTVNGFDRNTTDKDDDALDTSPSQKRSAAKSLGTFLAFLADPSEPLNYPNTHIAIPGRPKTLLATATAFVLLTVDSHVYTWGDARYGICLGRTISSTAPGDKPHVVDMLEGVGIRKIVVSERGWMMGAISEAGDAWVWGFEGPKDGEPNAAKEAETTWLEGVGFEDGVGLRRVVLLAKSVTSDAETGEEEADVDTEEEAEQEPEEEVDIVDMAMGRSHILVLDHKGRVWGIGSNRDGQLGLGDDGPKFVRQWTDLPLDKVCGSSQHGSTKDESTDQPNSDKEVLGVRAGYLTSLLVCQGAAEVSQSDEK